jgi:hypothetical protein
MMQIDVDYGGGKTRKTTTRNASLARKSSSESNNTCSSKIQFQDRESAKSFCCYLLHNEIYDLMEASSERANHIPEEYATFTNIKSLAMLSGVHHWILVPGTSSQFMLSSAIGIRKCWARYTSSTSKHHLCSRRLENSSLALRRVKSCK